MRSLVEHLVKSFRKEFEGISYIDTFSGLILKHEQAQEHEAEQAAAGDNGSGAGQARGMNGGGARGPPAHAVGGLVGSHGRGLNRSEEDYFNEDSDEEEQQQPPPTPIQQSGGGSSSQSGASVLSKRSPLHGCPSVMMIGRSCTNLPS